MKKELNLMTKLHFDELIDHSINLYRLHFKFLIRIMAYFYVPAVIILVYVTMKFNEYYIQVMRTISQPQQGADVSGIFANIGTLLSYSFGFTLLFLLLNMLASAAIIKGIDDRLAGGKAEEGEIAMSTLKKIVPLTVTTIIAMIMVGVGLIFCIIPFFVIGVYLIFVPQVIMIEGKWGFGAIGRSFSTVDGNFWATLLVILIYSLAYFFIASVISYALLLTPYINMITKIFRDGGQTDPDMMLKFYTDNAHLIIIQNVASNIIHMVMSPILNIALTLKFHNIRNLKEGTSLVHDIEKEKNSAV